MPIPSLTRFGYFAGAFMVLLVVGVMVLAPDTATRFALQLERRMAGLEMHTTHIEGFEIPYLAGGEGPTLLLLHGFSANKDNFTRVAKHLTPHFRVVVPDLPGFGDASAPDDAGYGLPAQRRRIEAIIDAIGLSGPLHVGGSSMGGYLAMALALENPDRVASLWLLAPFGLEGAEQSELRTHYVETGEIGLLAETPAEFDAVMELVFHERPYLPWFVRDTLAKRAAARYERYRAIFLDVQEAEPLNARVADIDVPTLLVWGEEDRALHPSGARVYVEANPDATDLQMMPAMGHLPMMEAPEATAERLLAFHARHFGD
ncbi:alpha/beta fold hydrolase [Algiphilus sp.]|uniref:alpha/beta fold hydrolase n=1 Tax=Algiphilus sp. TaxID=1872431 RepID=UPI0025BEC517|nr:alpha/beta fold hydrolase [Algiphilus sp.]MCK5770500.1 alpha/beta fold hydrolase [Algiphilus sp.]